MPQTDIVILKALLQSQPEFVSGNQLAQELGISRVGVWARLEKLREMDFSFEAIRHRGYRLLAEPASLNERLILAYLDLLETRIKLAFLSETDSTSNEAERMLASGEDTPFVVLASHQTAGRGRLGRAWHSPGEGNIYASFGFRPKLPPARMQSITLWLGLRLCDWINREYQIPVQVKWPNDLLLGGRKVAGMLTEARIDADHIRELVFGVGLNVTSRVKRWPKELAEVATCLSAERATPLLINQVAARLIQQVITAYESFIVGSHVHEFEVLWRRYDCLAGRTISARRGVETVSGVAEGINPEGALQLRLESGQLVSLHSGEVSLSGSPSETGDPTKAALAQL